MRDPRAQAMLSALVSAALFASCGHEASGPEYGGPPVCSIWPARVEMDTLVLGESVLQKVVITNEGGGYLESEDVNACEALQNRYTGPFRIGPKQTAETYFTYRPTQPGPQDCVTNLGFDLCEDVVVTGFALPSGWRPLGDGTDKEVRDLVSDGRDLYVHGWFSQAGGLRAERFARWDGQAWHPLGAGIHAAIGDMVLYHGDLIVTGFFSLPTADGEIARNIARWDGSTWSSMGDGIPPDGGRLAVHDDALYASAFSGLYRWDGNAWTVVGNAPGGVVAMLSFQGHLIVATTSMAYSWWKLGLWTFTDPGFELIAEKTAANLVIYHGELIVGTSSWDGSSWRTLGGGVSGGAGRVNAAAVHNDELFVTGWFGKAGDVTVRNIARWDGQSWKPVTTGIASTEGSPSPEGVALVSFQGELIVGGRFNLPGGVAANNIAAWSPP